MIEMRWSVRAGCDGPERVLQYRQQIDVTVRAGGAGTWDNASLARTANMQWSEWRDVPEVTEVADGQ
jgi:hypothetical protein